MSQLHDPLLWSIKKTALQCSVSVRTVQRWLETGELPYVRFNRRSIRIPSVAVRTFIQRKTAVSSLNHPTRERQPCAAQQLAEIIRFPRSR